MSVLWKPRLFLLLGLLCLSCWSLCGAEFAEPIRPLAPHPALSTGKMAFRFDGNIDVYVIPAQGGQARRLTCHPQNDAVVGWRPASAAALFSSVRSDRRDIERIFSVRLNGEGMPEPYARNQNARILRSEASREASRKTRTMAEPT